MSIIVLPNSTIYNQLLISIKLNPIITYPKPQHYNIRV